MFLPGQLGTGSRAAPTGVQRLLQLMIESCNKIWHINVKYNGKTDLYQLTNQPASYLDFHFKEVQVRAAPSLTAPTRGEQGRIYQGTL